MRGEGFCDINEISCDTSFLVGNGMSFSPNLTCNVQDFLILRNGEKHYMTEYIVDGILETIVEVHCPVHLVQISSRSRSLRQDQIFIEGHIVSVSYDGINFGDKHDMFVYDSKCQNPDSASNPPKFNLQAKTCFIEGRCLLDRDHNVSNNCLKCDSGSPFEWSIDSNSSECALHIVKPTEHKDTDVMLIAGPIIGAVAGILVILSAAIILRNCKIQRKKIAVNDRQTRAPSYQTNCLYAASLNFEISSAPRNTRQ